MLRDTLPEPQQFMHTLFARGDAAHETAEAAPVVDTPVEGAAIEPAPEEQAEVFESEFVAAQSMEEAPLVAEEPASRTDWLDALLPEETPTTEPEFHERADLEAPARAAADHEEAVLPGDEFAMAPTADDASPAVVVAIDIPVESETVDLAAAAPAAEAPAEVTADEPAAETPAEVMADDPVAAVDMEEISPADVVQFMDAPIAAQIPEAFAAQLSAQPERHEPAFVPAATGLGETFTELPALADDPQPEGRLELAEMDEDLLEIFVQEGADILDHSDTLMANLRASPHDREIVGGLQRDLHTLKGGARMAGLAPIGDLSHAMESLLDTISDNRRVMDRITVESLERGFDRLHGLVQRVARRQAIAMPANAIARFEGLVSGDVYAPTAETVAPVSEARMPPPSRPSPHSRPPAASAAHRRRRGRCRGSTTRTLPRARAAGDDPRAFGFARLAGELCRRSVDLPLRA
jgi:chemosensory pili system protein ChpA (sensor histidine kinase/response regulator)